MIIPFSIPAWIQVKKNAEKYGMSITFSVDPLTGKHTGHIFYNGESYPFKLEIYPKNMILSLKKYNPDIFVNWANSVEAPYRVLYQAQSEYAFHAEWYFEVEEELVTKEIQRMKRANNINIIEAFETLEDIPYEEDENIIDADFEEIEEEKA